MLFQLFWNERKATDILEQRKVENILEQRKVTDIGTKEGDRHWNNKERWKIYWEGAEKQVLPRLQQKKEKKR